MEARFKLAMFAMIIAFCLITQNVIAQWQVNTNNPPGSDYWGQVNPASNAQSIGIGDFDGNSVVPEAALHINTNSGFLPTSPTFDPGEVFRTDAPSGLTAWRMFSGNVAANEKFSIVNPNGSKNIELSAVQNGSLSLLTDSKNRLCITNTGWVGIGTTEPAYTLHVAGSFSAKQIFIEDKNLLALITEMQTEISELKKLLAAR